MNYFIITVVWLLYSTLSYGLIYSHFRDESAYGTKEEEEADHKGAFWLSFWGPGSLLLSSLLIGRVNFRFRREKGLPLFVIPHMLFTE